MARHAELASDEEWKAANCRLCPRCRSAVEKINGCNTIICGQNAHGGNRQPGCGHRFNWKDAKPYKARADGAPRLSAAAQPALARRGAVSGRGVRHLFAECGLCGSGGKCILGPRFRCIHCQNFSVCMKCETRLAEEHEEGHVFQIMFEDEVDWSKTGVVLPKGTRARIRRRASYLAAPAAVGAAGDAMEEDGGGGGGGQPGASSASGQGRKRRADNSAGLEGVIKGQKRGKYMLELPDGAGTRHVAAEHLQPLLTQRQAEQLLVTGIGAAAAAGSSASAASSSGGGGGAAGSGGGRA